MEQRVPADLVPAIKDVVHHLVIGDYAALMADGRAATWTIATLQSIVDQIADLEGPLVELPDTEFEHDLALPLDDGGWGIDIHIWTTKGRSAFTLVLDIYTAADGYTVRIEDLRIV